MAKDKEKETMDKKGGVGKKKIPEDEIPELPEIEIPDELITLDESIRANNHELLVVKKENKELREKLKDLNTKLTKVLENLKGNYPDKSFDQRMSPEVMEIEMENADNQINFYKREIAFLQKRTKEGDQVDQIQELEKECYALKAEEDGLEKELSKLKNRYLVLSNKSKKIESSGSQKAKVSAMIEKRKAYILQKKRVTEWSSKLEKTIEAQKDFTDKIHERYTEACKQLREEPELELEYDEEDKAIVKLKNNQKKSSPGLRTIIFDKSAKKKPISFNESLLMDDPDNYEMPKTDAEFTRLKEKVTSMFQSARVEERHVKLTVKRTRAKTTDISKRQETIELNKEYNLLKRQFDRMQMKMPLSRTLPVKNLIMVNEIRDNNGKICFYFGRCDNEVIGERHIIGSSIKTKVHNLSLWFHKGDIKGIRAEYTPVLKSTFVGQKTNLKQNISLIDKKILAITCIHGDRLYSLGLKVQTRNGVKQKIDIGYPPQDESDKLKTDTKELPKYQFIRSATFYGEIEDKDDDEDGEDQEIEKSEDLAKSQLHKSVINNGEPLLTKNGANFIYPENLKKSQYIKLTGIMFDIVA